MHVKMEQIPELQTGSPLSGIEPLTFVVKNFNDGRAFASDMQEVVGYVGGSEHKIIIDKKVTDVVAQAIANELTRNGHKVLKEGDTDKTDVVIYGSVIRYWFAYTSYVFSGRSSATVQADIVAFTTKYPEDLLMKRYTGNYIINSGGSGSFIRDILNQALLNMVKEFTTDPEFLDCLQKIKQAEKEDN